MRVKDHYGNTIVYTKLSEANPEVIRHPCRIYEVCKKNSYPANNLADDYNEQSSSGARDGP